jgi:ABC-2 type transport system permease protein
VTEGGERSSTEKIAQFLPIGFLILLILSVMVGGQYLVTTTIEEKSNRVVEVLLSAVSSKQLMTGKILGQMFVGLVMLVMYSGLGVGGMVAFKLLHLLDAITVVYFIIYFVIAYLLFAATLAAVGSAVNDLREAQSLQTPVMLCLIIPYFLWFPIARDPNSWFAIIMSMVPPISPFAMILRLTSTQPPPTWQVLLSIAIGAAAVYGAIWAAAKIFRVGLLMYGKPPNFSTLIRWVRMA